jgi:hypothetical protein
VRNRRHLKRKKMRPRAVTGKKLGPARGHE